MSEPLSGCVGPNCASFQKSTGQEKDESGGRPSFRPQNSPGSIFTAYEVQVVDFRSQGDLYQQVTSGCAEPSKDQPCVRLELYLHRAGEDQLL